MAYELYYWPSIQGRGALLAEQANLQEKIDAEDGWDLDRRIEIALDALRCPPPDVRRRATLRR